MRISLSADPMFRSNHSMMEYLGINRNAGLVEYAIKHHLVSKSAAVVLTWMHP
jgi:hypothetical protein